MDGSVDRCNGEAAVRDEACGHLHDARMRFVLRSTVPHEDERSPPSRALRRPQNGRYATAVRLHDEFARDHVRSGVGPLVARVLQLR